MLSFAKISSAMFLITSMSCFFSPHAFSEEAASFWHLKEYVGQCTHDGDQYTCGSSVLVYNSQSGAIYNCDGVNSGNGSFEPRAFCRKLTAPTNGVTEVLGPTTGYAGIQQKFVDQFNPTDKHYFARNIQYYWVVAGRETRLKLYFCAPLTFVNVAAKCSEASVAAP